MQTNILIVDDSISFRTVLKTALEKDSFKVYQACDVEEALLVLESYPIQILVSDVNFEYDSTDSSPRNEFQRGGLTLVQKVRAKATLKALPILIISSENSEELRAEFKKHHITAWIRKPIQSTQLTTAVHKIIEISKLSNL